MFTTPLPNSPVSESTIHIKKLLKLNEVQDDSLSDSILKAVDYLISTGGKGYQQVLLNITISIVNVSNKSQPETSSNVEAEGTSKDGNIRGKVGTETLSFCQEVPINDSPTSSIVTPMRTKLKQEQQMNKVENTKSKVSTETPKSREKSHDDSSKRRSSIVTSIKSELKQEQRTNKDDNIRNTETSKSRDKSTDDSSKRRSSVVSSMRSELKQESKNGKDKVNTETQLKHKTNEDKRNEKSVVQSSPMRKEINKRKGTFVNRNVQALEDALMKRIEVRKMALVLIPEKLAKLKLQPRVEKSSKRKNDNSICHLSPKKSNKKKSKNAKEERT